MKRSDKTMKPSGQGHAMGSGFEEIDETLAEKVVFVIGRLSGESVTLREVLQLIGREGMTIFCIFLTLPFMVPVSIPGVSTVFGLVILLIGIGIMTNRPPWLPERLMQKKFPSAKLRLALEKGTVWVHRLERVSRPSIPVLTQGLGMARFNGLMLVAGALLLMAPFGLIPFSNTLPGLAILFLAVGILQRDGRSIILGYMTLLVTVFYFTFLLLGGFALLHGLVEWLLASGGGTAGASPQ